MEYASLEQVRADFPQVVCGKLGLVLAEGRSPRLVVDSSISGVTQSCEMPNHMFLPKIVDVANCAPTSLGAEDWLAASIDVRKAHRLIKVHPKDQALLTFSWQDRYFVCRNLNFGARPSSFWWARVAGCLVRLSHAILFLQHLLWDYVDDFLAGFQRSTVPLHLSTWIVLFLVLNVPISWHKCAMAPEVLRLGWSINLWSWKVELGEQKRCVLMAQIRTLTSLWCFLRPLLSPLFAVLRNIPASNVAVSPTLWQALLAATDQHGTVTGRVPHGSFPVGAKIICVGHTNIQNRSDLERVVFLERRLWVSVQDSDQTLRLMNANSHAALQAWLDLLNSSALVCCMRAAPTLRIIAEADAFADSIQCGLGLGRSRHLAIGGVHLVFLASLPGRVARARTSVCRFTPKPHLCVGIAGAALPALVCASYAASVPHVGYCSSAYRQCRCGTVSDKGLSSVPALAHVVRAHMHFQRFSGIQGEMARIPGYKNTLADELSRLSGSPGPLENSMRVHPPLACLLGMGTGVALSPRIQQ